MKLIYSKFNESEPQIELETEFNLNTQASEQDEEEIKHINEIHHIIEVHAKAFHLDLKECSYDFKTSDSIKVEFNIKVEGNPHLAAMMIIAAHTAIVQNDEFQLDALYGTIQISHDKDESCLVFNAVPTEALDVTRH